MPNIRKTISVAPVAKVVATTKTEVNLRPAVRRILLTELTAYGKQAVARKAADTAMKKHKAKIRDIREAAGETKIEIDGYSTSDVCSTTTSIDEKLLLQFISVAQLESCKVTKPKKAYEKITVPGVDDE